MDEIYWHYFMNTGNVEAYLLYKDVKREDQEENGDPPFRFWYDGDQEDGGLERRLN